MEGQSWTTECKAFFTTLPVVLALLLLLALLVLYGVSVWLLLPAEIVVDIDCSVVINLVREKSLKLILFSTTTTRVMSQQRLLGAIIIRNPNVRHMCWECHDIHDWLFMCNDCKMRLCGCCVDNELCEIKDACGEVESPEKENDPFLCFDCFKARRTETVISKIIAETNGIVKGCSCTVCKGVIEKRKKEQEVNGAQKELEVITPM